MYKMDKKIAVLTLSMLLSFHHGLHAQARYLNYNRIIEVTAKLKALERNRDKVEAFEKNFKSSYVNSWILFPRKYNAINTLMLELLDTAETKPANPHSATLQVLEMIDDELKGLINRYGYRKELIALSHRTSQLRATLNKGIPLNPLYAARLKQEAQDLLAEVMLTESSGDAVEKYVKKHVQKMKQKEEEKEQKKSQPTEPESYEGTDSKG